MPNNQSGKRTPKFYDYTLNERLRDLLSNDRTSNFADALGVTSESVRQWTSGYSRPDIDKLPAIVKYFDCTADYLLGLCEVRNGHEQEMLVFEHERLSRLSLSRKTSVLSALANILDTCDDLAECPQLQEKYTAMISDITFNLSGSVQLMSDIKHLDNREESDEKRWLYMLCISRVKDAAISAIQRFCVEIESEARRYLPSNYDDVKKMYSDLISSTEKELKQKDGDANADTEE